MTPPREPRFSIGDCLQGYGGIAGYVQEIHWIPELQTFGYEIAVPVASGLEAIGSFLLEPSSHRLG